MNLPKNERCPLYARFSAAVGNSFGYTLTSPRCEGRNKSNACLSLLARSVPTCGPEVDNAHGPYFVSAIGQARSKSSSQSKDDSPTLGGRRGSAIEKD
jgi:hypothetical protein